MHFIFLLLITVWFGCSYVGADEDVAIISSDVKRGADYRNALFGVYSCRVKKAADAVRDKFQVRLSFNGFCTYTFMYL